jgi:hypothetical protein
MAHWHITGEGEVPLWQILSQKWIGNHGQGRIFRAGGFLHEWLKQNRKRKFGME